MSGWNINNQSNFGYNSMRNESKISIDALDTQGVKDITTFINGTNTWLNPNILNLDGYNLNDTTFLTGNKTWSTVLTISGILAVNKGGTGQDFSLASTGIIHLNTGVMSSSKIILSDLYNDINIGSDACNDYTLKKSILNTSKLFLINDQPSGDSRFSFIFGWFNNNNFEQYVNFAPNSASWSNCTEMNIVLYPTYDQNLWKSAQLKCISTGIINQSQFQLRLDDNVVWQLYSPSSPSALETQYTTLISGNLYNYNTAMLYDGNYLGKYITMNVIKNYSLTTTNIPNNLIVASTKLSAINPTSTKILHGDDTWAQLSNNDIADWTINVIKLIGSGSWTQFLDGSKVFWVPYITALWGFDSNASHFINGLKQWVNVNYSDITGTLTITNSNITDNTISLGKITHTGNLQWNLLLHGDSSFSQIYNADISANTIIAKDKILYNGLAATEFTLLSSNSSVTWKTSIGGNSAQDYNDTTGESLLWKDFYFYNNTTNNNGDHFTRFHWKTSNNTSQLIAFASDSNWTSCTTTKFRLHSYSWTALSATKSFTIEQSNTTGNIQESITTFKTDNDTHMKLYGVQSTLNPHWTFTSSVVIQNYLYNSSWTKAWNNYADEYMTSYMIQNMLSVKGSATNLNRKFLKADYTVDTLTFFGTWPTEYMITSSWTNHLTAISDDTTFNAASTWWGFKSKFKST